MSGNFDQAPLIFDYPTVDLYVKPLRVVPYIKLNFVKVRSGVSFGDLIGDMGPQPEPVAWEGKSSGDTAEYMWDLDHER